MKSRGTQCHSNSVDGEQLTRFTLATLRELVDKVGGRELLRRRLEELARCTDPQPLETEQLARATLETKAADLRRKLDLASRNILEVENASLIKAMEKRYADDERELAATEAELAKLPPPATRNAVDMDAEVEAAMVLFDEIERLVDDPGAKEAINVMLERIGLRIGLFFEEGLKGTRKVRKVARGVIALGNHPLPVPLYGKPQVLPSAALEADVQRRLSAALEAVGQPGASGPPIASGACGREDHREAPRESLEVTARRRDVVPAESADPPANGDGRDIRPAETVPVGIAPSRPQQRIAAAGLEPATPGL